MNKTILIIDNYDSFTFNIAQIIGGLKYEPVVFRNDAIKISGIKKINPSRIILSPGPGKPQDSGITLRALKEFAGKIPILGICLGHQAIGYFYGARVIKSGNPVHGKSVEIIHDGKGVFKSLPEKIKVGLYNSLLIERESLSGEFILSAESRSGQVMGIRHRFLPLEGIQFHPDSILTRHGEAMLKNWLES